MKKSFLIVVFILFFASISFALDWHSGGKVTIQWHEVSKIKETDIISYVVYVKNKATNSEKIYKETNALEMVVDLNEEGEYYLGVSAKRETANKFIVESDINWSDTNGEHTPNPFGVRFYVEPGIPKGLTIK